MSNENYYCLNTANKFTLASQYVNNQTLNSKLMKTGYPGSEKQLRDAPQKLSEPLMLAAKLSGKTSCTNLHEVMNTLGYIDKLG